MSSSSAAACRRFSNPTNNNNNNMLFLRTIVSLSVLATAAEAWTITTPTSSRAFTASSLLRPITLPSSRVSSLSSSSRRRSFKMTAFMSSSSGPYPDENDEDEEECPDEEECEIDWSKMPGGFEEDDVEDQASLIDEEEEIIFYDDFANDLDVLPSLSSSSSSSTTMPEAEPRTTPQPSMSTVSSSSSSSDATTTTKDDAASSRQFQYGLLSLEMNWKMAEGAEDCDVEQPQTCGSSECETCQGRGYVTCQFCRGTRYLKFDGVDDFVPCSICQPTTTSKGLPTGASNNASPTHPPGTVTCQKCQGSGWIAEWTQLAYHNLPKEDGNDKDSNNNNSRLLP